MPLSVAKNTRLVAGLATWLALLAASIVAIALIVGFTDLVPFAMLVIIWCAMLGVFVAALFHLKRKSH